MVAVQFIAHMLLEHTKQTCGNAGSNLEPDFVITGTNLAIDVDEGYVQLFIAYNLS
jgi:hypothetical protein